MKRRSRRYISLILAIVLIIGVTPMKWGVQSVKAEDSFTGGIVVENGQWKGWTWSVFGNSTTTDKNTIKSNSNGSVTLKTTGNGGKIASKNEGINYLSYELTKEQDFILKTTAKIDAWPATNQSAFGLMVRAAVGTHGDTQEASPLNSAFVGGSRQNGLYLGSYRNEDSRSNIGSLQSDNKIIAGQSYDLCMQKVGDNLSMWFNGELVATESVDDFITGEQMYVGLFTSRDCTLTYNNTSLAVREDGDIVVINQTNPAKSQYIAGNSYDDIDLTGFSANVTVGGASKTITAADCAIKEYDFSKITDDGAIILDYFGSEISVPIKVTTETVTDITLNYLPVKTEYAVGDTQIDWNGLNATVTYNSGVTKQLEDLIAANDPDTEVTYDFSVPGNTSIVVMHTHGGVTKQISIPVVVSDATVTSIEIMGPDQLTYYSGIAVNADAYKKGLLIKANYSDNTHKILSTGFIVEPKNVALDTAVKGDYVYVVSFGGKTAEYTLKVVDRTVTTLEISKYPNTTTFVKGTDFACDGIEVKAVYDSGEKEAVDTADVTVNHDQFNKDEVGEYKISVSATVDSKLLETSYTAAVKDKIDFSYDDLEWTGTVFGQSINKEREPVVTVNEDGTKTITVEQEGGKGKVTGDGHDGICYYYTKLNPATDNFEITAKVTVDYFITNSTSPDYGEGFGIMLRDSIGTDQDASVYYANAASVGGSNGTYNVFGRYGILSQSDISGKVNIDKFGRVPKNDLSSQIKTPTDFYLTLKKDNTGILATMKKADNTSIVNDINDYRVYLPADTFTSQDKDNMYLGFVAARGAKMEVNSADINIKVTSATADAPQVTLPANPVTPQITYDSMLVTGDEDYKISTTVNTKGLLTIKQDGQTLVSQDAVEAGTYSYPASLTVGANKFQLYFEPDATQNISSVSPLIFNATVTRKIYTTTDTPIYIAPDGSKDGDGSKEHPLDAMTALSYCRIGQAIYAKEGTYQFEQAEQTFKGNNGTQSQMKQLIADPDNTESVIFDFSVDGQPSENTLCLSGDYWYFKGITFINGGGVRLGGNHNVMEACNFAYNTNSGLSICRTDDATDIIDWPSYNQIINCNSYSNRDASDGNADGYAIKLTSGYGNIMKGCVSCYNSDDGWDLYAKTGVIGAVKIYNCVSFANGYSYDPVNKSITRTQGDGNGFKLGGQGYAVEHEVHNCYSFGNAANGFTNNSDPMGNYIDCTSYNNGGANLQLHIYSNAVPQFNVQGFKSFSDDTYANVEGLGATISDSDDVCLEPNSNESNYFYNSETGKSMNSAGKELTKYNFASFTQFASYIKGGIEGIQRDEDGSINLGTFLLYRDVSALTDAIEEGKKAIAENDISGIYTQSSIDALRAAVEQAEQALESDADQSVINQLLENVGTALKQLTENSEQEPGQDEDPSGDISTDQNGEGNISQTEDSQTINDQNSDQASENVKTGDNTQISGYIICATLAFLMLVVFCIGSWRKKKASQKNKI